VLILCYRGHMKRTLPLALVTLALAGFAPAQDRTMHCYKADYYTLQKGKTADFIQAHTWEVCAFGDGHVYTTLVIGDESFHDDYSPAQWRLKRAEQHKIEKQLAAEELTCNLYVKEGKEPPANLNCHAREIQKLTESQ